MATPEHPTDQGKEQLEAWIEAQAREHWPDADVEYRGRARNQHHHWRIRVPEMGSYWIAATDAVVEDPGARRHARDSLERSNWTERLPGVPTHGLLLREGGRLLTWDPARDDSTGMF